MLRMQKTFPILCAVLLLSGCAVQEPVGRRDKFESYLQEMVAKEHFTGVALVMRDGKILHAKAYGAAAGNRANDIETKFHVGSITKEFTAATVLQLVEKGM